MNETTAVTLDAMGKAVAENFPGLNDVFELLDGNVITRPYSNAGRGLVWLYLRHVGHVEKKLAAETALRTVTVVPSVVTGSDAYRRAIAALERI